MKTQLLLLAVITFPLSVLGQSNADSTSLKGKVTFEGYLDVYYAYDFNKPASGDRPYFVSMARHNEFTINLAFISIKYSSSRLRAKVTPGFGTYMNANYATEPSGLRNILEASAGVKLWRNKNIWMDVGVFGAPYTNEGPISKDQLTYTRSFSAEYSPYYLSGIKLSAPLSQKLYASLYLINGWQQIQDVNSKKSLGTQLEYRQSNQLSVYWNTYFGDERSALYPEYRTRLFTDLYFVYSKDKWSASGCYYIGVQKRTDLAEGVWWQVNMIGRYNLLDDLSITGRLEYFNDPDQIVVTSITNSPAFSTFSGSFGANLRIADHMLIRAEYRTFFSSQPVYQRAGEDVKNSNLLAGSVTLWF